MKRKLGLFLAATLVATSLVGCSSSQTSYMQETKKISNWESVESDLKGTVTMKVPVVEPVATDSITKTQTEVTKPVTKYETINVKFDGKGYAVNASKKDAQAYVTLNIKADKDMLDIQNVKIYVDADKVFISKNYFEGLMKATGEELPKALKDLKQEYIVIDSGISNEDLATNPEYKAMENYITAMSSPEKQEEMMANITKVMEKVDFDVPVSKSDRTYTISLNSEQLFDKALKSMDNIVANSEEIVKILGLQDQIKMTKEEYAELKKSYTENGRSEMATSIATAKEMMKGSSFTTKETFGEDTHVLDMNFKIAVKDMMDMDMNMNQTSKMVEKRTIVIPKVENAISFEKYMQILEPQEVPATTVAPSTPTTKAVA